MPVTTPVESTTASGCSTVCVKRTCMPMWIKTKPGIRPVSFMLGCLNAASPTRLFVSAASGGGRICSSAQGFSRSSSAWMTKRVARAWRALKTLRMGIAMVTMLHT